MESLSRWFADLLSAGPGPGGAGSGPVTITIIGSGGKTSLAWLLAACLARRSSRVLVTPATKMLLPEPAEQRFDRFCNGIPPAPLAGITLAGSFNEKTGKLESLPPPGLERIVRDYDCVIIEGDGSRQLPLKGWAGHEPVVFPFTDITVGMLPIWPLGMTISETIIHRLPQFCALSGASPGEIITLAHLAAVISGAGGAESSRSLFTAAQGKTILFINQIEDEPAFVRACELIALLPPEFRSGLYRIAAGSVRQDILWGVGNGEWRMENGEWGMENGE